VSTISVMSMPCVWIRGDPEVGVPELALDDDQRDAFPSHLDGVGVAKPVRARAIAARPPGRRCGASSG
jgi:hypothetical protein